ncbi:short-chain dehydrogenase [Pontibacillus halophilus JSM 076056 = DSM 19796]|uniref:Short-chain dehydrogenase n=1 Tax=Pontibacillus halophilus JSM 076056 = DSM 19796 TaxID=1385510 RepID=A0A0A5GC27_9BACI|nr:oxidoreductase [Pontibacillus halophilus]KGX90741.1 short-chain dehydrogenase [Pontibacillus halophilus JSM 076056 = DSM 19796]
MKQVILLTGASSGIGEATVQQLLTKGFIVYAGARRVERMEGLKSKGAHTLALDVTDDASMQAAVNQIIDEQGRIDILVNNAGYGSYGALEDVSIEEAKRQFEVNVFGLARLTQLVLPYMRQQGAGKIMNISSIGGKIAEPLGAWYHSSKFAVEGLSDSLRMELAPFGIDVVVIEPGPVRSEWGSIAGESVRNVSGDTAYHEQAKGLGKLLDQVNDPNFGASPNLIAHTISKASLSSKPRTRYAPGTTAKAILLIRKLASDRLFDGIMNRVVRSKNK